MCLCMDVCNFKEMGCCCFIIYDLIRYVSGAFLLNIYFCYLIIFFSINWVGNQWFQNCHVHQHLSNLQHNDFLWIMCCRFFIIMVHVEYILVSWMQNLPAISYLGVVLVLYFVLRFERMNWNLQCLTIFCAEHHFGPPIGTWHQLLNDCWSLHLDGCISKICPQEISSTANNL